MFYIIISYGCKCACEEYKKESTLHILTTITEKKNQENLLILELFQEI